MQMKLSLNTRKLQLLA